jgi:hypothetical protein
MENRACQGKLDSTSTTPRGRSSKAFVEENFRKKETRNLTGNLLIIGLADASPIVKWI